MLSPVLLLLLVSTAALGGAENNYSFHFDDGAGLSGTSTHYQFESRHGDFFSQNGTPVSQFTVNRSYGSGVLHYGGVVSDDENHYYGGVSLGPAALAYFEGEGESFSRAPNPFYEDLNHYYFHGGTHSSFHVRGAAASITLTKGMSVQLAASNVTAPEMQDRRGYYAGITGRVLSLGMFQLDRGDEKVGQGLNLEFSSTKLGLAYQEIRSQYGARVSRVALEWNSTPRSSLAIEFEQARNDLYSESDEQRIMLRFRKRLGRASVLNAAEKTEEASKQPGFGTAVGVGLGLGVAAVAVSSGGDNDGARRFSVRNDAAFSVLNRINPISVRENREHGGWIYRNADNTFGFTEPVPGTVASVNIGNPFTSVPTGTTASASYHTHGGPDPRFDNENFSPQDIRADNLARTDGYLGTPGGFMKLHDFETGTVTVVGRINN